MAHPYPTRHAEKARAESATMNCSECDEKRDVVIFKMYQEQCQRCQKGKAIAPLLSRWFHGFDRRMFLASNEEQQQFLKWMYTTKPSPSRMHAELVSLNRVTIIHAQTAMAIFDWATKEVGNGVYGYEHNLIHLIIDPWCLTLKRTPHYVFCYYNEATYHPSGITDVTHKLPQTKEAVLAHWRQWIQSTLTFAC